MADSIEETLDVIRQIYGRHLAEAYRARAGTWEELPPTPAKPVGEYDPYARFIREG